MVSEAQVMEVLTPWLGAELLGVIVPTVDEIGRMLNAFTVKQEIDSLSQQIDSLLFRAVHGATRGRMLIPLPDGTWVRVRVEDFAVMTDDLLLLAFNDFPVDGYHLSWLRDYSMRQASLSALQALYTRFAPLQTQAELDAIASVARSCHPSFRWAHWLSQR